MMKKKLLVLLLVLVLVIGVTAITSMAEETRTNGHQNHCVCGGTLSDHAKTVSGHTCDTNVEWEPWDGTTALKNGGHYYLNDTEGDGVITVSDTISIKGISAAICLNGLELTSANRTILVEAQTNKETALSISDCRGGGVISSSSTGVAPILHSFTANDSRNGPLTINLYGGALVAKNSSVNTGEGGVLRLGNGTRGATFNMYGGSISGGKTIKNGGNVYISSYCTFNLYDGIVTGGQTALRGGNFYSGGTFNMYGGIVSDGQAAKDGGNIYGNKNQSMSLLGGQILGGQALLNGPCVYAESMKSLILGGDVQIQELALKATTFATQALTGSVGLSAAPGNLSNLGQIAQGEEACFTSKMPSGYALTFDNGNVSFVKLPHQNHCVCGGTLSDHAKTVSGHTCDTNVEWEPWDGTTTLQDGHYYYLVDTDNDGVVNISSTITVTGKSLAICLNGLELNSGAIRTFKADTSATKATALSICDCQGGGKACTAYTGVAPILHTYNRNGGQTTINLFGGALVAEDNDSSGGEAGVLRLGNGGTDTVIFNMYGGSISGGITAKRGGSVYITNYCTFNLYDGVVSGGTATEGGNFYNDGALNVYGGKISGGTATDGGNIYSKRTTKLIGGETAWGQADNGGNLYVTSGTLTMTGGKINRGTATYNGGNIAAYGGTVNVSNADITAGIATNNGGETATYGGNLYLDTNKAVKIENAIIQGGKSTHGGNFYISKNAINVSITGCQITDGHATLTCGATKNTGTGGNIYAVSGSVVALKDCTISGGRAFRAGNVDAHGKMTVENCIISGGHAKISGGNVVSYNNGNFTADSTTVIENGTSDGDGGNIFITASGEVTLNGTKIVGGTAASEGGSIAVESAGSSCTLNGVTLEGGSAPSGNAIIVKTGTTFTIMNSTVTSASATNNPMAYVMAGGALTIENAQLENTGSAGATIHNCGALKLSGTVDLAGQPLDIVLDGRKDSGAAADVTGLTGSEAPMTVTRWIDDDQQLDVGLFASAAEEGQTAFFKSWAAGYGVNYADGALYIAPSPVQVMGEKGVLGGYDSLDEAFAAADEDAVYFCINADLDGQTVNQNVLLDLQGHHLTNTTVNEGIELQLMDNSANGGGSVSGTIPGQIQPIVEQNGKTYLTMQKDGVFFVYDSSVQLTHVSLDPANDALGYKAQISGNDAIMGYITEFGFRMWVNENNVKTYTKTENITSTLTLRLKNILAAGGGETEIYGEAFISLTVNGETFTVTSAEYKITMKEVVETVNKVLDEDRGSYSKIQVSALQTLLDKNKKAVSGWSTRSIMYWLPVADEMVQIMAADSMVLLKNENQALPLAKDTKINLFGYNATTQGFLVSGGGSGGTRTATKNKVDMLQAFQDAGVEVNVDLYNAYAAWDDLDLDDNSTAASTPMCTLTNPGEDFYSEERIANAKAFSDTAVVVIGRWSRENARVTDDNGVVHYEVPMIQVKSKMADDPSRTYLQLTTEEEYMLKVVTENFDNVIVLLNLCNTMELGFLDDYGIDAAMFIGTPGQSGARAIPRLLYGQITPSGKTADIYPYNHKADPTWANACVDLSDRNNKYITYQEGMYYGYRWYETAFADGIQLTVNGIAQDFSTEEGYRKIVQFPFGFGLSYTQFAWELVEAPSGAINQATDSFTVKVKVTNTGNVAGKDVVQMYLNAPYTPGGIEKAALTLVDFAKTDTLQPGQSQILELSFTAYDLAAYDCYDANKNGFAGYELENGSYTFKLMTDSHTSTQLEFTLQVAQNIRITTDPVTGTVVENLFTGENAYGSPVDGGVTYMTRADFAGTFPTARVAGNQTVTVTPTYTGELKTIVYGQDSGLYLVTREDGSKATLADLTGETNNVLVWNKDLLLQLQDYDNPLWEQFLAQITKEETAVMIKEGGFRVNGTESLGLIETEESDGPSGVNRVESSVRTAWPGPSLNACSWNKGLLYDMGRAVAMDARKADIQGWYAPGINLHRSPYNSRNFEYYSEDPVLSGALGAQCISGAKEEGLICYLKHFAVSEAGKNPSLVKTWLTEQTMREVYLRAFEIAVKDGGTNAVMAAFNCIGDVLCPHNSALLQGILRNEWGFRGTVITDWWSEYMTINDGVLAGNDKMLMPADKETAQEVDLSDDGGQIANASRQAVKNIVYSVVDSCVSGRLYERPVSNLDVEDATDEGAAGEE